MKKKLVIKQNYKILLGKKPNFKKCSFSHYRNCVICNFLLSKGCRASTLPNINVENLDLENELIKYRHIKNRRQQIVSMSNSLKLILIIFLYFYICNILEGI